MIDSNQLVRKMNCFAEEREKFDHYLIEIFDANQNYFRSKVYIENKARLLIRQLNLKVVKSASHEYGSQGITMAFILSSSHAIFHTWPEYSYLHIDIFSCSNVQNVEKIKKIVGGLFESNKITVKRIKYG